MDIWTIIGLIGIAIGLTGYGLMQAGKLEEQAAPYLTMNLTASLLLAISLTNHWNLGSFLLQLAWIAISLYGFAQLYLRRRRG